MTCNLTPPPLAFDHHSGVQFHRFANSKTRKFVVEGVKETEEAPEAAARSIFVLGFHILGFCCVD